MISDKTFVGLMVIMFAVAFFDIIIGIGVGLSKLTAIIFFVCAMSIVGIVWYLWSIFFSLKGPVN